MRCAVQSTTTLADGRVFTVGGSWGAAENTIPKNGEIFSLASGWSPLTNCLVCKWPFDRQTYDLQCSDTVGKANNLAIT